MTEDQTLADIDRLRDLPVSLIAALDYWDSCRGRAFAPAWCDFDLMALPAKIIPSTTVIDIAENLPDSTYRFWGTHMSVMYGIDMTGGCPYKIHTPAFGQVLLERHQKMLREKKPSSTHFRFMTGNLDKRSHTVLRLPLSDDGTNVHQIVVISDYSSEALERIGESGLAFISMVEAVEP